MAQNDWATWQAEIGGAMVDHQNLGIEHGIVGYWRMEGARTKPAYPVALWRPDGAESMTFQIGRQRPMNSATDATEWAEFLGSGWLHCKAVRKAEWASALEHGIWPSDGKDSRQRTDDEKLGIAPTEGGNNPPREELIEDQIAAAVESAKKIEKVTNADEARKANEMAERLQALYRLGDAERDAQKRPHDEAAKAIQARWLPIITPAEMERKRLIAAAKEWIKAEEVRVAREAEAERKRRQAEIDAANEAIRKANEEAAGNAPIGVEVELQQEIAPAKVETPKVQAGSTYGRATGLRTVTRANVTDMKALLLALLATKHPELLALAQKLADRAAVAGIPLDGMEITKTRE